MSSFISASRHPDKNKNPEAEDTFVKITQSYEVIFIFNNKMITDPDTLKFLSYLHTPCVRGKLMCMLLFIIDLVK